MKKAEHELAQATLHRSLSLAERVGNVPLMSVVFTNLGILAARSGSLREAETWFKRSILLAEQNNDQFYKSIFHIYLAMVHQDQGQLPEARAGVFKALTIGRVIGNTPCIGFALVALGKLRLTLSRQAYETSTGGIRHGSLSPSQADMRSPADMPIRFLQRARKTVQRALNLEGIEMETRNEGHLLEAEISLLLGDLGTAEHLTISILKRAREQKWTDLHARVQRLLGEMLTAQGKPEQAYEQFEEAIAVFRRCSMPLECARTCSKTILQSKQALSGGLAIYTRHGTSFWNARLHMIFRRLSISLPYLCLLDALDLLEDDIARNLERICFSLPSRKVMPFRLLCNDALLYFEVSKDATPNIVQRCAGNKMRITCPQHLGWPTFLS